ncbi:MAG: GntR family transcriptional regulator [Chloroflexi bacterium]|nr:GntR family transcriptional regulator [Chloroflexota bacterium]
MTRTTLSIAPLDGPTSLKDHAYRRIKEAILTLQLKPGAALVEAELAERLGISKTPVRDALLELRREGLVTKIPYSGTFVSEITEQDIREIIQIRAVLEGLAAKLATPMFADAELEHLDQLIAEELVAIDHGNIELAAKLNAQFHEIILSKVENERLVALIENFEDQLQRFRTLSSQLKGRLGKSAEEHRVVLMALRERDAEQAERAFRAHLLSVLDDLTREGMQLETKEPR